MKKYFLVACAIVLAGAASAFTTFANYLTIVPSAITTANVSSGLTYDAAAVPTCTVASTTPCKIDLELIGDPSVTDEASFLIYLNENFDTPEERVTEVLSLEDGFKN